MLQFLQIREASLLWQVQRLTACLALPGILLLNPVLLACACLPLCIHVWIGLGEIIEDYVHGHALKAFSLLCVRCVMCKMAKILFVLCIL